MTRFCAVCENPVSDQATTCPSCGYGLVGADTTQKLSPVSASKEEPLRASLNIPFVLQSRLRVIKGPQIGMVYELPKKEQAIGRNPHCHIFLNDMTVSRKHARIFWDQDAFVIEDTNSFNGVWVKGRPVSSARLNAGDEIQIGVFLLAFEQD